MDTRQVPSTLPSTGSDVLTYDHARDLLHVLENSKTVMETYLEILEEEAGVSPGKKKKKSWWGLHCWPNKRKRIYANVTLITVSLQLLNLVILTVLDAWPKKDSGEEQFWKASAPTMIILEVLNLVLVIFTSGRLAKQILRHNINSFLMAQAYVSTVLLFAGIYTVTYRLDAKGWKFMNENLYKNPVQVFVLYAKFLFYSISTATLCGSDNVLPIEWYNCICAGFQMLLSFCYFASILGSAVSPDFAHAPHSNTIPASLEHGNSSSRPHRSLSALGRQYGFHQCSRCHSNLQSCASPVESPDGDVGQAEDRMQRRERAVSAVMEISGRSPIVHQHELLRVVQPVAVNSLQHNTAQQPIGRNILF